jgi:hypothetical protein
MAAEILLRSAAEQKIGANSAAEGNAQTFDPQS